MILLLKKKKQPATLKIKVIAGTHDYGFEYVYMQIEPLEYDGVVTQTDRIKAPISLSKPRTRSIFVDFIPGRYKLTMFGKQEDEKEVAMLDTETCNISYVGEGVLVSGENTIIVDFHDDEYTLNGEKIPTIGVSLVDSF
jgi:hypothetical protein